MSNDIEQYRPGFEAWARAEGYDTAREGDGYLWPVTNGAWKIWTAAKREASTERAAVYFYRQKGAREWIESTDDPRPRLERSPAASCFEYRTLYAERGAGALTDEAKDAARYRFLRDAKWFNEGFAKTEPQASAFHYVGDLLDSKVDAAIAHTKAQEGT